MTTSSLWRRSGVALSILALGGLTLVGCGSTPAPEGSAAELAAKSDGPTAGFADDGDQDRAPEFVLKDLEGAEFALADTHGQVRLIDFWATWCAPCREEIPMLNELDQKYGDQGFTILAISDESVDVLREFEKEMGVTYTNLVDTGEVAEEFLVLGLPTGFLLDREGRIVERFVGPKPARILEKQIRELLELPPA